MTVEIIISQPQAQVTPVTDKYNVPFVSANIQFLNTIKGEKGEATILTIGQNGNWYLDGVDTGLKAQGNDGVGITDIEKTGTVGLVDEYTITLSDNSTFLFYVTNGVVGRGIVSITKTSTNELTDTYTITYTDNTTSTFDVTNGVDGVSVESITLYETVGLVDTYEIVYSTGSRSYFNVMNGEAGDDGREVEIQNSGTYIQWRYVGETNWNNIVALADLKGDTGANIELQKSATHIQWRVVGDTTWINLVALSDLKGDAGRGIVSFNLINTVGKTKTYRLLYTDDTYVDIPIIDGNDGVDGITPHIGLNGNWYIGLTDTGVKAAGLDGINGTDGADGVGITGIEKTGTTLNVDEYTITFSDANTFLFYVTNGLNGSDGEDGNDGRGIVSIVKTSTVGLVDTYTITYTDLTNSTFDVTNGSGGGEANIIEVVQVNGTPLSITDKTVNVLVPTEADDIGAEPANENIQTHISDATKHIDTTTDEFSGTIDETNDKFTIWDNSLLKWIRFSFTSMKTWLSSLYLKLDQTTPQTINGILQNQSTAALESAPLGDELLTSSGWDSTNWTGDFANGFTHTTGNVTPLTNTLAALNEALYQISFVVTNLTAGSFTVGFGNETSGIYTSTNAWGVKTTGTGTFSIVPTSNFNGTIVVSIKSITGTYAATNVIKDSLGNVTFERRSSLTTLNNNFAGVGAGRYNTTGIYNNFNGYAAGRSNTTGYQNNFNGYAAGRSNTTGSQNNFNGAYAGYLNTTGYRNNFNGAYAGYLNTTGIYNNFNGYAAGYSNTTGYQNNFNGYFAGYSNTTGYQNNFNGYFAGYLNTTGYQNNFNGAYAGRYLADGVTANQTSNNSIFLGSNTKSKQAGQTNEIVIGNNAIGNGSNTVTLGHTDITNTYLRGLVSAPKGVQIGDNTDVASYENRGATRYRENAGGSFYEMVMKKKDGSYEWTAIVSHQ